MKTLLSALVLVALCGCTKHLDVNAPDKALNAAAFSAMLTKNFTYTVSEYYTANTELDVPFVNSEDTYTFDGPTHDGWISSKFPCIEYHYNFRVFESGDSILFDWLDFKIAPQTFTVTDYQEDQWFILKIGETYIKYVRISQ